MIRKLALLVPAILLACSGANKPMPVNGAGGQSGSGAVAPVATLVTPAPWTSGPPTKVVEVEGITEYKLDNGLRVLLFPDASQEKVTINITYFVGSRHEGYGETGMAHLLEHMVFKGTPKHPGIFKLLGNHGAQFNGTTWFDRTNYYETMAATDENLEFAVGMEADRMINSAISADELAKEFSVVRNEFERSENSPSSVLMDRVISASYLWHNYGKSTIGNRSDIERVPADSLRAFYKKYYRPDNAMLVIAGKFDNKKALDLVQQHFGSIPKPSVPLPKTYTTEPGQDGEREVTLRRSGDSQWIIAVYHGVPGAHLDGPAFDAATSILSDEPSGALYKALVEKKLATKVNSFVFPTRDPGVAIFMVEVPKGTKLAPVKAKMLSIIEGYGESKITATDVNRYVRRSDKQLENLWANSQRTAVALSEYAAMGDWRMLFLTRDRTAKLTKNDVARVASTYFKRSNRTVGVFIPTKNIDRASVPEQPDVLAMVKDYKGGKRIAEGEVFDASFDNIEARTERYTMKSGTKVAFLPKRTRGQKVRARILINFSDEKSLTRLVTASSMVGEMLMRGAKGYSYQALKDKLDEFKSSISITTDPGQATISISSKREHLAEVINLLDLILRTATFPKDQFEIIKREQLTTLESQKQDPQALAINSLRRTFRPFPKANIRYVPTVEESITRLKKLKLSDLKKVHKTWGATYATAAFVGDFDPTVLRAQLDKTLGTWKSKKKFRRIANDYKAGKGGQVKIETPDKKMAFILAAKTLRLRDDDPDYAALSIIGYVLGGGASSRLITRLRQKEGISYGAFGGVQAGPLDHLGAIFGGAILAPQNADNGMKMMLEEMNKLFSKGIDDKELAEAKASFIKRDMTALANDSGIVGKLAMGLFVNRTFVYQKQMHAKIRKLTGADIRKAIKKHLSTEGLTLIKAGDMAGAKAAGIKPDDKSKK